MTNQALRIDLFPSGSQHGFFATLRHPLDDKPGHPEFWEIAFVIEWMTYRFGETGLPLEAGRPVRNSAPGLTVAGLRPFRSCTPAPLSTLRHVAPSEGHGAKREYHGEVRRCGWRNWKFASSPAGCVPDTQL